MQWGTFNCDPLPVAVLAMQLAMVEGPDRLPADKGTQEVLCRKLCVLEADLTEVTNLISVWSSLLGDYKLCNMFIKMNFTEHEALMRLSFLLGIVSTFGVR